MKAHKSWGYSRYTPMFDAADDIYICRIAPFANGFSFDTKEPPANAYSVYLRKRDEVDFVCIGTMYSTCFTVNGLDDITDYEFYVSEDGKKAMYALCARVHRSEA